MTTVAVKVAEETVVEETVAVAMVAEETAAEEMVVEEMVEATEGAVGAEATAVATVEGCWWRR